MKARESSFPRNYTFRISVDLLTIASHLLLAAVGKSYASFLQAYQGQQSSLTPPLKFWGRFSTNVTFLNSGHIRVAKMLVVHTIVIKGAIYVRH